MGCDIHLHTEIKVNGKWEHYGQPCVPRNYLLFALMADVRNDGEVKAVSKPKGLPSDISLVTQLDVLSWSMDGHSWSWLSSDELVKLEEAWAKVKSKEWNGSDLEHHHFGYLFGNSWAGFKKYPQDYANRPGREQVQDVRFVFWFDN